MKSKEELYSLKSEVELLNSKLCELSDDELAQVTGGIKFAVRTRGCFMTARKDVFCDTADHKLSDIID